MIFIEFCADYIQMAQNNLRRIWEMRLMAKIHLRDIPICKSLRPGINNNLAVIANVHDGDTYTIVFDQINTNTNRYVKHNLRLANVDTPELKLHNHSAIAICETRLGSAIANLLHQILLCQYIHVEFVDTNDRYDRILANVYVNLSRVDNLEVKDLGEWLLSRGYARPYNDPNKNRWSDLTDADVNRLIRQINIDKYNWMHFGKII
jgi:endonuclease YncB( thermonuclease family)